MHTITHPPIDRTLRQWYVPLLVGILFIVTSVVAFASPVASFLTLSLLFSLSFFFGGIAEVIFAISSRHEVPNWGWTLTFGIVTFLVGILLLMNPALSMSTLALYIGFVVLFRSISAISYALDLQRYGSNDWVSLFILGLLGSLVAFILIWNPLIAGLSAVVLVATSFFLTGLFSILLSFQLKGMYSEVVKEDS